MSKESSDFQQGPISPTLVSEIISESPNIDAGAFSIFLGNVRADTIENKIVREIEYSAYSPMCEIVMAEIIQQIRLKYPDLKSIKIIHSIGTVQAGEFSLLVFVACGHRKQSFEAVQEAVELIKEKLPVWKKEIFEDGTHGWPGSKG